MCDFTNFLLHSTPPPPTHPGSADPIRGKTMRGKQSVNRGGHTRSLSCSQLPWSSFSCSIYILVFLEMIAHLFALTARSYQGLFDNAGDKTCAITNLGRCLLCSRRQLHYLQGVPAQSVIFFGGLRKMNLSNLQCCKVHYLKTF